MREQERQSEGHSSMADYVLDIDKFNINDTSMMIIDSSANPWRTIRLN